MDALSEGAIAGSVVGLISLEALAWVWLGLGIRILLDILTSYFILLMLSHFLCFIECIGEHCSVICCRFELVKVGLIVFVANFFARCLLFEFSYRFTSIFITMLCASDKDISI